MDPATVALIVKSLDIAFTFANYYMNREQAIEKKGEMLDQMKRIKIAREGILAEGVSQAEADKILDDLTDAALVDLRAAMARL